MLGCTWPTEVGVTWPWRCLWLWGSEQTDAASFLLHSSLWPLSSYHCIAPGQTLVVVLFLQVCVY